MIVHQQSLFPYEHIAFQERLSKLLFLECDSCCVSAFRDYYDSSYDYGGTIVGGLLIYGTIIYFGMVFGGGEEDDLGF